MKNLFFNTFKTATALIIKSWKLILLLLLIFTINYKNIPKIQTIKIEFTKPVHGFMAIIYWTPEYIKTIQDNRKNVVGKAILVLERITDKKKFKVAYNLSIETFVESEGEKFMHKCFSQNTLPKVIKITSKKSKKNTNEDDPNFYERNEPFFFFKDLNFDENDELVLVEESLETDYEYKIQRVFEFQDTQLVEFNYFPSNVFTYSRNFIGRIDYQKKEISGSRYYSCCEYDADFYRLDKNIKNEFQLYKTERINFDKPIIIKYYTK